MASKHKRSTIKIDGKKLKSLLENTTGKDIYTLSVENGFSRNLLNEACRKGYASAVVQNLVKLYGISPEAYAVKDPEPPKKGQMSFDDIEEIKREELKALIQDVLFEIFYNSEIVIQNDKVKGNRLFLRERGAQ
jgi:hypothetical protein